MAKKSTEKQVVTASDMRNMRLIPSKTRRILGTAAHEYLRRRLGDYIDTREIRERTGIRAPTLNEWRTRGVLKATKLTGKWYYSVKSLIAAMKSDDTDQ